MLDIEFASQKRNANDKVIFLRHIKYIGNKKWLIKKIVSIGLKKLEQPLSSELTTAICIKIES